VLGGGTAVNSALYWKPHPSDFDINFPTGWKSADMQSLIAKVWDLIPGVSPCNCPQSTGADMCDRQSTPPEMESFIYNKALKRSLRVWKLQASRT